MGGGDGVGGDNNKLLGIISLLKWFAVYELDTICKHTNACKSLINNNDCAKKTSSVFRVPLVKTTIRMEKKLRTHFPISICSERVFTYTKERYKHGCSISLHTTADCI